MTLLPETEWFSFEIFLKNRRHLINNSHHAYPILLYFVVMNIKERYKLENKSLLGFLKIKSIIQCNLKIPIMKIRASLTPKLQIWILNIIAPKNYCSVCFENMNRIIILQNLATVLRLTPIGPPPSPPFESVPDCCLDKFSV